MRTPIPAILHECQKKDLRNLQFISDSIPNRLIRVASGAPRREAGRKKEKREQAPELHASLSIEVSIAYDMRILRDILAAGSIPDLHLARATNEGRRRLIIFLRAQGIEI